MNVIQTIAIEGLPIIKAGDNLARLICEAAKRQGSPIQNSDIVVVTHVVVSRAEGRVIDLNEVVPSEFAKNIAGQCKDPAFVEVVLREAKSIVRMVDGKLVTETKHGLVCANSGVDRSNVPGERKVVLLPDNSDLSARKIRKEIKRLTGCDAAVIISDTHGRPIRRGEINVAIGVSGIKPIRDRRGEKDLFGYIMRIKQTAVADELSSAAELVIGQTNEAVPAAIIRGYDYPRSESAKATGLMRPKEKDIFV
jgi:coenzyme F420-0:L-glutamate ligase/coenzyme F420-1:gamma-L-glutamate ligase